MFFYLSLRTLVAPPQDNADPNAIPAKVDAEQQDVANAESTDGAEPSREVLGQDEPDDESAVKSTVADTEWFSIGSMDPTTNHNLLITLSNQGGAIERIENHSERFRRRTRLSPCRYPQRIPRVFCGTDKRFDRRDGRQRGWSWDACITCGGGDR